VWRATTLMVVLGLGAAAPATARPPLVDSDPVAIAVTRAVEYWHGTPCAGAVTLVSGVSVEAPSSGENVPHFPIRPAAMWASWWTPAGVNSFTAPATTFTSCVLHVNRAVWPDWFADDRNFAAFCKEILHEYGHFEGYPDKGALAGTIEYELPDPVRLPLCERYRLVYGRRTFIGRLTAAGRPHRRSSRANRQVRQPHRRSRGLRG
jgi:hypothetical protein